MKQILGIRKNSLNEEIPSSLKKPRCHSMMVETNPKLEKEKSEILFDEEDIEEIEKKPTKNIMEGIFKTKDPLITWQSYEKERISSHKFLFLLKCSSDIRKNLGWKILGSFGDVKRVISSLA